MRQNIILSPFASTELIAALISHLAPLRKKI
jgi:hypothetical protein